MTRASASSQTPQADFLQLCDLVKTYGKQPAVNHINLSIGRGEIFALLGSSGCGKTTLLRMLAGFEIPSSGRIILNGQDLSGLPPYARPLNMMFQSYALFPHLSVWDNVAFGLRRDGLPGAQVNAQVEAMLTLVQLSAYAQRKPHQLSGGQQQRVALARSLAKKPQLLLLDEPLGALDKKPREQTQMELVTILREVGVTCVMVTHDQEEAMTMATRIGVMSEGRLMQVGPPSEVYESPHNCFVADFIGNVNLLNGRLLLRESTHSVIESADCAHYVAQSVAGHQGSTLTVALRPEKIRLSFEAPPALEGAPAGHNCVQGTLTERAYCGSFTVYRMALASGQTLKISTSNTDRHAAQAMQPGGPSLGPVVTQCVFGTDLMTQALAAQTPSLGRRVVIGIPVLWLLLFFMVPFLLVLRISVSETDGVSIKDLLVMRDGWPTLSIKFDNYLAVSRDALYLDTYLSSLTYAAYTTAICLMIGYPFAYFMARAQKAWQAVLLMMVMLPFWTSFLLRVYAWKGLLSEGGWVHQVVTLLHLDHLLVALGWIEAPGQLLNSPFSLILGMSYTYLPFMVLPLFATLSKMDLRLIEAATDLGATPWVAFWKITVPLSKAGVMAGAMLVFIPCVGEYVIPELLGGPQTLMIGRVLWDEFFSNNDWPLASTLAVVMVVLTIVPLALFNKYQAQSAQGQS